MIAYYILLVVVVVVAAIAAIWGYGNLQKIKKLSLQNRAICGEEDRVLDFLHHLGESIEKESSASRLQQIIVNGLVDVIGAKGGAIYLIDPVRQILVPKFVSENCPQVISVPAEITKQARKDPRVLASHIRMAHQGNDEGILGACLSAGHPLLVADVKSHPCMGDSFVNLHGNVAAMVAPLRHADGDLGVLIVARDHEKGVFDEHEFSVFQSVAEQCSYALGNAIVHIEANEKRSLESELRHARDVQRVLLPQASPQIAGYAIAGINIPARIISGDYYDFINLDEDRLGIVIADVCGKGVPAGLLMVMCRSLLRAYTFGETSPTKVLASVNRQLFPDTKEDMFITITYMILDGKNNKLTISRAGHDPALLYQRVTGEVIQLKTPGLAIGLDEGAVFERKTKDVEFFLEAGDCLLLHTDGLKETVNADDEEYGLQRLKDNFRECAPKGASTVLQDMQMSHKEFQGNTPQKDDITLVVLEKF